MAGIGTIRLLLPVVASNFSVISAGSVPLALSVSPLALAAAAASLVTILVSAHIPAGKSARTPVMEFPGKYRLLRARYGRGGGGGNPTERPLRTASILNL